MGKVIAFAGKGGVGKTTVATLVIRHLSVTGETPILAVDADPNSNLGETMGVDVHTTIGDIRENYMRDPQGIPSGMDKINYLETLVEQALIEKPTFDLLVMGRQEGQGCYCMVNNILNNFTDRLEASYKYLVVDNEAGMEHISRLTTKNVDALIIVADASRRGLQAGFRISDLASELHIGVVKKYLILNQVKEDIPEEMKRLIAEQGIEFAGVVPEDGELYDYDAKGLPTIGMPEENPAVQAAFKIFDRIFS